MGVGELYNPHNRRAKHAARFYKKSEADITFEEWPGETHQVRSEVFQTTKLRDWLIANGPLKQAESKFSEARLAEQSGKLGFALTLYDEISKIVPNQELCIEAAVSAKKLSQQAEAQLAEAEKAMLKNLALRPPNS